MTFSEFAAGFYSSRRNLPGRTPLMCTALPRDDAAQQAQMSVMARQRPDRHSVMSMPLMILKWA